MSEILIVTGDTWHSPEIVSRGIASLQSTYRLPVSFDFMSAPKDILTPALLGRYPIIFCCKGNNIATGEPWFDSEIAEVNPSDFLAYVKKGGYFVAIHAGTSYYPDVTRIEPRHQQPNEDYMQLLGARFKGHPPRCPVTMKKSSEHPIMKNVTDFTVRDEHYQLDVFAKDAELLFTTSSASGGSNKPGGYIRHIGKGAVIVLTPGHTLSVWTHPSYQQLIANVITWCLKSTDSTLDYQ